MSDQIKNLLIGVFVVAAFALITFMLLFLHPTVGDDGRVIKVRFADIDKVNRGTRVTYGGFPVGEVTEIREIDDPTSPRKARNGYVYIYEITAVVDSSVKIYSTDMVSLKTAGLLGEKSIAITPLPVKPGEKLREIDDEIIYADESGSLDEMLKELRKLSVKIEEGVEDFKTTFKTINDEKVIEKLSSTIENVLEITTELNQKDKWRTLLDNAVAVTEDTKTLVKNTDKVISDAQTVVGSTAKGQGTIGRLFMKDDIYLRFNSLLSKAEVILDDINHYGILFQSDKRWQRLRARRLNLLYSLQSPQEFRNYFNEEVDQIVTSLSRVNMVLNESYSEDNFDTLVENGEFKQALAELIRRVKMMEESIQMYNTQVISVGE